MLNFSHRSCHFPRSFFDQYLARVPGMGTWAAEFLVAPLVLVCFDERGKEETDCKMFDAVALLRGQMSRLHSLTSDWRGVAMHLSMLTLSDKYYVGRLQSYSNEYGDKDCLLSDYRGIITIIPISTKSAFSRISIKYSDVSNLNP